VPELSSAGHHERVGVAAVLVTAVAAFLAVACGRPLGNGECGRLLDHYTELLVKEEDPNVTPEGVAHRQGEARMAAKNDPRFEFSECPKRVSRRGYECAMEAPSVDAIERCLVF
jgi:hypothetical protein